MDLDSRIEAHALANAVKYDGKANPSNVLPKVIAEFPETKKDIAGLRAKIDAIVTEVNTLGKDAQLSKLQALAPEMLEKKERKEKDLPPLPNAIEGKVVTRLPPEPSKYLHLGHALSFVINTIYAERYHGKVVLRFEDTNPEKENQEFVDAIIDDITNYLKIPLAATRFVSDDMDTLYDYARKLIQADGAYMCFCDQETMRKGREEMRECACRGKPEAEHLAAWDEFVAGKHQKGESVLRFKGDMASQNTVMRDPVLFRMVTTPHYKHGAKYKVWPTYDFYNPVEDVLCGVTHILRSNEFELRIELQQAIKRKLGLVDQEVLQYGRLNISGAVTQGRQIRELIGTGEYIGWDDPRLATLKGLKRRGFKREAYFELVKTLGLSPHPVTLDFTMLSAANRKIVENCDRYSFIAEPVTIHIAGVSGTRAITLDAHPDRKGGRPLIAGADYLVSKEDADAFGEKRVRMMGNLTFKKDAQGDSEGYSLVQTEQTKGGHDMIINWLPAETSEIVPVEVMMPDATVRKGFAEKNISRLSVDEVIQFERFGFCRFDRAENEVYHFWFAHK
jgi:glutamyl-tRNA synthetase